MIKLRTYLASATLVFTAFFGEAFAAANQVLSEPEFLIAGLSVNDEEKDGADLYRDGDIYWLPLEQLSEWTEFEYSLVENSLQITTRLGDVKIPPDQLLEMPEGLHINLDTLKDIGIQAEFDQNAYALRVYAPWLGMTPTTAALVSAPIAPDHRPAKAGVSHFYNRLDSHFNAKNNAGSSFLYSDAMGYLVNGVWGLQTTADHEQNTELSQLYWSKFNRYAALRLGTATANPGPLLNAPDFSGLQFAYSNHSIYPHLAATSSVSRQMFVDDASYSHDISGSGPRGGIAELRLNDRPVARVRIALDGKFLFKRLPIGKGNTDRVEVALYEFSLAQPPIEIISYSVASKPRAVSTGEWMLNAGLGNQGSSIEEMSKGEFTSYGSLRYGVSNFLTVEAATQQQADRDNGMYLGIITSLGSNFATTLGTARHGQSTINSAEAWGTWDTLKANYAGLQESDDETDSSSESHHLWVDWTLRNNFSLNLRGLQKEENKETEEEYLAAGFNWKITPNATLTLQPVDGEEYDTRLSLRNTQNNAYLQLRAARDSYGIGINYAFNEAFNVSADYSETNDLDTTSAAAYYRPRHNNDNVYSAQLSRQQERLGFSLAWQYRLSQNTQFSFSYFRQMLDDDSPLESLSLSESESVALSIESELWFSKQSWRSAHLKTDSTHGAVSAKIFDADGNILDNENIRLQLEGTRSNLRSRENGEQTLTDLAPGDYNLKLLAEGLPIEYENSNSTLRIRIAPAATTDVQIVLKANYGVAGLLSVDQQPLPHEWVEIWNDSERVAEAKTDSYGYYQVTGLEPGKYEVRHTNLKRSFELLDDFIFDVNLSNIEPPTAVASADSSNASGAIPDANSATPRVAALFSGADTAIEAAVNTFAELTDIGLALPSGVNGRIYYKNEPLGQVSVQLQQEGRKIASLSSDDYGYYSFHNLSPGEYRVVVGHSVRTFYLSKNRAYGVDLHLDEQSVEHPFNEIWSQQ